MLLTLDSPHGVSISQLDLQIPLPLAFLHIVKLSLPLLQLWKNDNSVSTAYENGNEVGNLQCIDLDTFSVINFAFAFKE